MIAQAIPFAISPLLTRIYTPEDFGVFGVFMAITSILAVSINGRYDSAILLADSDDDAINVAGVGLIISTTISIICLFLVMLLNTKTIGHFYHNNLGIFIYFIPLSIFLSGVFNLLNYSNLRMKLFKDIAKASVYKSFGLACAQLIVGCLKSGAIGLIFGSIIAQLFANGKLLRNLLKTKAHRSLCLLSMKKQAVKYKKLPIYSLFPIIDSLTLSLPLIWLGGLYGPVVLGYFAFCYRLLGAPSALIGNSIGSVFFQKIAEIFRLKKNCDAKDQGFETKTSDENIAHEKTSVTGHLLNALAKLSVLGCVMFLPIILLAPFLFDTFFGKDWHDSGEYARILSIAFLARFIVSPLSCIFSVTNQLILSFFWRLIRFPSTVFVFLAAKKMKFSIYSFLFLYVMNDVLMYLLYLIIIFYAAKNAKNWI